MLLHVSTPNVSSSGSLLCYLGKLHKYNCSSCCNCTYVLFKALLFVCAGCVIHSMGDSQDIRCIGGLSFCMPFTSSCLMVSNFALWGMPFCPGFFLGIFFWRCFPWDTLICLVFCCFYQLVWQFVILFFCFVICGDFNCFSSYSMVENSYKMVFGMVGLLLKYNYNSCCNCTYVIQQGKKASSLRMTHLVSKHVGA